MEQVRGVLERILPARKPTGLSALPKRNQSDSALPMVPPLPGTPGPGVVSIVDEPMVLISPECGDDTSRPASRAGEGPNLEGTGKFQNQTLERFRQQLLRRFLSLHDAFERLNLSVSRDRALSLPEFRNALERLGVGEQDSKAIFVAMDSHSVGGVTLSEFLHALVDVSPEALLWELRCRLIRFGIGPHSLHKAVELVQWPQHGWLSKATKVKRRGARRSKGTAARSVSPGRPGGLHASHSAPALTSAEKHEGYSPPAGGVPEEVAATASEAGPRPGTSPSKSRTFTFQFQRGDWLKLCTSMYLTLLEAERLFGHLADPDRGAVDLRVMFETLRTRVEPDVPLERFVTKAIGRYESLDNAFQAFAEASSPPGETSKALQLFATEEEVMRWPGFYALAISLNVNDHCAAELWNVLSKSNLVYGRMAEMKAENAGMDLAGELLEEGEMSITKEVFLHELLLWAPDTALGELKGQLCERFGNLEEGYRALQQQLNTRAHLSPGEMEARLRAAGIKNCNVEGALRTVPSTKDGFVSLDATISTMRAIRPRSSNRLPSKLSDGAKSTIRNQTQPLWEQLREVQSDMRRGIDRPDQRSRTGTGWGGSTPSCPPKAADRRKFTEAIHGAVKLSESHRSRTVLKNAHRQVLKLEERWAGGATPPPGPAVAGPTLRALMAQSHARRPSGLPDASPTASLGRRQSSPAVIAMDPGGP